MNQIIIQKNTVGRLMYSLSSTTRKADIRAMEKCKEFFKSKNHDKIIFTLCDKGLAININD